MTHPECLHFPDCTLFRNSLIAISAFGPLLLGKVKAKNNYEFCDFFFAVVVFVFIQVAGHPLLRY